MSICKNIEVFRTVVVTGRQSNSVGYFLGKWISISNINIYRNFKGIYKSLFVCCSLISYMSFYTRFYISFLFLLT